MIARPSGFTALTATLALGAFALGACRSESIQNGAPAPSETVSSGTTIIAREALDAAPPECTVHLVSDAFTAAHAKAAGSVKVEGDYTRAMASVTVERPGAETWSGSFSGPRDAFFEMLRRRICAASRVYALKPDGNKDPTKGPVVMAAFEMEPDEKSDVQNLCDAFSHAAPDAGADERDRAAMQWVEDVLTTTKWDAWRRSFAHERATLMTQKRDAKSLFVERGTALENSANALGLKCAAAAEWKKR